MKYNQKTVDKIRCKLSRSMRMTIYRNVNKDREDYIGYSTVCEFLNKYRQAMSETHLEKRLAVYDEAVRLLTEKGLKL